jgi:hypothetical protein
VSISVAVDDGELRPGGKYHGIDPLRRHGGSEAVAVALFVPQSFDGFGGLLDRLCGSSFVRGRLMQRVSELRLRDRLHRSKGEAWMPRDLGIHVILEGGRGLRWRGTKSSTGKRIDNLGARVLREALGKVDAGKGRVSVPSRRPVLSSAMVFSNWARMRGSSPAL